MERCTTQPSIHRITNRNRGWARSQMSGCTTWWPITSKNREPGIFSTCSLGPFVAPQGESSDVVLEPSDIRVHTLVIDYTNKDSNPLEHVGFYDVSLVAFLSFLVLCFS